MAGVMRRGTADSIDLQDGSPEERRFYEYMEDYADYWRDEPRFDRTATDNATADIAQPRIDVACLVRLINYAIRTQFGKLHRNRRRLKRCS